MSGREEFTTPPTSASSQSGGTVAVSNRPEVRNVTRRQTNTVPAGSVEAIQIFAPIGSNYNLRAVFVLARATGGSGTHGWIIENAGQVRFLNVKSSASDNARFDNGHAATATDTEQPPSPAAQQIAIQNARATENKPLTIKYLNDTDADQTQDRKIRLMFEEVSY